jgi:signal transduction histidine kinase
MTDASDARGNELFQEAVKVLHRGRDRLFVQLMIAQWAFATGMAFVSLYSGPAGRDSAAARLAYALLGGVFLTGPMIGLASRRPGSVLTRQFAAVAQMLWSALIVYLTGGRLETHFYVFGSLVFLAFYRDRQVLFTATAVLAAEHLLGLARAPGHASGTGWSSLLEHAFWVGFELSVLLVAMHRNLAEMRALARRQAETEALYAALEKKVATRMQELETSREQYRMLVETTQAVPWQWNIHSRQFTYVGPQAAALLGCSCETWLEPGFLDQRMHSEDARAMANDWRNGGYDFEFRLRREDDRWIWVRNIVSARDDGSNLLNGLLLDITEKRHMEVELQQAQKLEAVGRLASGVAHEINTPVQFASDSVHFLRDSFGDLLPLLTRYRRIRDLAREGVVPAHVLAEAERAEVAADIDFLLENMPKAVERSSEGLDRVADIVRAMKAFAHPDATEKAPADINQAILTTITVARNEYKYVANLETDLGELPAVLCHVGTLNQVFLNLIVNAAHAIGDVVRDTDDKGLIKVSTRLDDNQIVVGVSDTGAGIPEEIRTRVFDPFFTTKEVGRGTGQGLSIARSVIVDKHGGTIEFESEVGRGTTFTIRLPVDGRPRNVAAAA